DTKIQAIMLGNNIEIEGIKSIVENLRRMQRAKQFTSQYLDAPDEIDGCVAEVKKLIEERIKSFLKGVKALSNINNFYEADKKIDSITLVRTLLGKYCTEDIFNQIEALKESQNNVVLKDVVNKYSEMDITGYTLNPPTDIFEKFKVANNTNPIYNQASQIIQEKIVAKFRAELEQAKSQKPPEPENLHIRKFESAVKYLPEGMRNALEVELKHCKDDILQIILCNDNNLTTAFNSGDLKPIKNFLLEYQSSKVMQPSVTKSREVVLKQVQEITLKINQNFEQHDIREALGNVQKLYEYKIELENVVDFRRSCSEVQLRITKTFQDAYLGFMNRFFNPNISVVTNETVEAGEKSFICLIEFMKFTDELKDQHILSQMFPEDFNEKMNRLIGKTSDYSSEHQKKYKDALEKIDIVSLVDILETTYKWNFLFTKIESSASMYSNNDTLVNTFIKVIAELTPYSHMLDSVSHKIEELRGELINKELINDDTKEFSTHRDEFYRKLNEKLSILNKAKLLGEHNIGIDVKKVEQECQESLERKIRKISSAIETFLEKFSEESRLTRQEYDNFDLYYTNLTSFKQEIKVTPHCGIHEKIEKIDKRFFDKIQTWERLAERTLTVQNVATSLINMKRAANHISSFKVRINGRIDEVLNHYKSTAKDAMALAKLGAILNQDKSGTGQSIISEHQIFQGYSLSLFNEKTRKHDINYVLQHLKGDFVDKNQLKKRYDEFHATYEVLIKQYLTPNIELDKLISDIKLIAGNTKQEPNCIVWDAPVRNKVPRLTAHIFALWTLKNAEHYFEAEGSEDKNNYLLQPHAAQIISIFRMLGIGDTKEKLNNNLVQIGTGEGKSVTLGATASLFALLGFDVRCACYSEYLSQRDYTAFLSLFDSLGLLNYIRYGTFNKLCEDMINENGDIRQIVEHLVSKGSNDAIQNRQHIKRAKILLIDEVDVFFSREFYGNVYTPSASLQDSSITSLVNSIWTQRKYLNLKRVKATAEYKVCCDRFPKWELLIEEAVKDMLSDVNNYESHDYVVNQDKIGYIEQDNIVYNVVYGYKTLFAYHSEYEKGNVSKESLNENISIRIKCGSFSYAEIPLQFKYIMGVTGTLETLSDPEKQVIQNVYKIAKNTYIPSVFGQNNLKFIEKDDIMIENSDDYFNVIKREIDNRLVGRSSGKRAVLVLFESKRKLREFYDSNVLAPLKELVAYLTEEASLEEKENRIKRATASDQITLLTRTFGRGTDFICHDQNVTANGGTHVIQTFLSEELSEEVQIKGRTARQGDFGSYSMVLLDRDLEKFHIEKENIEDVKKGKGILTRIAGALHLTEKRYDTVYALLHDKRNCLFKTQYEANTKYVEQAKERHQAAQNFLSSLNSGEIDSVKKFLGEENKGAEGNWKSRTVCLMDATGSMVHLLYNCKHTVGTMFERASEILIDHGISSDSFQIQFVVYRNYDSREDKILQSSPWETKPDNLRAFMNKIEVEGGWGNEAIEIGLWHANRENERENITQVILIGDAPPNTKNEVNEKRQRYGQSFWKKTKFAQSTYYEDELAKLEVDGIPVHAFFVEQRAEESFKKIAKKTGGRCAMLDINSSSGSEMLTDLVTEEILRNVGGCLKGDDLVKAYRNKFGKSFT
ncbi:unnamed protein product, partial [Didymodactylos carnosus]